MFGEDEPGRPQCVVQYWINAFAICIYVAFMAEWMDQIEIRKLVIAVKYNPF